MSVRRTADGSEICRLPGTAATESYGGLEFSPDGRFLHQMAFSRAGGRLWKLDGPEPVKLLDDGHVASAFDPARVRSVATYPDRTVRMFDLETLRETGRFEHNLTPFCRVCWNPRNSLLALYSPGNETCQIVDAETGEVRRELRIAGGVNWVDWHPDGEILAVCNESNRRIILIDYRKNQNILPPLEGFTGQISCRFSHDGNWLVTCDWSHLLRIWDARTGQPVLAHSGGSTVLQFNPDDTLIGPVVQGNSLRILRFHPNNALRTLVTPGGFSNNDCPGRQGRASCVAVDTENGISLIDADRGKELASLPTPKNRGLRFDPDDRSLWTCGVSGLLRWPFSTDPGDPGVARFGPPTCLIGHFTNYLWGASRDGSVIAIPDGYRGTILTDPDNRQSTRLGPQKDVRHCDVSPDGRWVATGSHTVTGASAASVWDAVTRERVDLTVTGLCCVGFSPDGKWLLTTGGGCRLWEVGSWREGSKLPGNNESFSFSPEGSVLALGGDQMGTIVLVAPESGREVARLTSIETTRMLPICFTADGGCLAAVGAENQRLYLFDLRAIRRSLQDANLDWDTSPLPPAAPAPQELARVIVDMGYLRAKPAPAPPP